MKAIKLSENYRIEKDTYSWVLVFNELRKKENKKTGIKEDYIFDDRWYYPDIKQLLNKYIDLDLKDSKSLIELSYKIGVLTHTIDGLKNTIFKP